MITGIRKLYSSYADRFFAVCKNKLYEILAEDIYLERGTFESNKGMIKVAENETQLIFVDGENGYVYNLASNTLTKITDTDYQYGTHVININGYFIQNVLGTGQFIYSDLRNGLEWNALDYATAEYTPDIIVAVEKTNNEAWLFKKKTTEIWYHTGDADAPFMRIPHAFMDIGIASPYCTGNINNTMFWLGTNEQGNNQVWMASNYIPKKISTHAIDYLLSQIQDVSDAVGYCYQQEGHFFYVVNFIKGNKTIVYDITTGLWHQRGKYNSVTGQNDVQHYCTCAMWRGKTYVGNRTNGKIYELNLDTFTDESDTIQRIRTGGHVHSDRERLFFSKFELDIERGVGLVSGQGSDPLLRLFFSDDGGKTWKNSLTGSPGKVGEYQQRLVWHRLGSSRDRVFRVILTDPIKCVLLGATIDVEWEVKT